MFLSYPELPVSKLASKPQSSLSKESKLCMQQHSSTVNKAMLQHSSTIKEADDCDGESVVATAKNSNEPTSSGSTAEDSPHIEAKILYHVRQARQALTWQRVLTSY
jgi:hypothetical protein